MLITTIIIFIISAIPLNIAVRMLGGKTNILKTSLVVFISSIVIHLIKDFFSIWGSFIAFIAMLFIYKQTFEMGMLRAFFAWILQFIIIILLIFLVASVFAASILL